ncbi:MAG: hypothetical protein ACP5RM_00280 [Candidatus Micrarchaeia archaeon]
MNAKDIMAMSEIKVRVKRTGMFQLITFTPRLVTVGNEKFAELYTKKMIDLSELKRVANELGAPVEADTLRAFPEGKGAKDFMA